MKRRNGNWNIKASKKIFENDFFKVTEDSVVQPDGKDSDYATIDLKPGVAVLPVDDEGFVYLTEQFRYAIGRKNIESIAGALDNELPIDGARREAREELGIEAADWISLGRMEAITAITNAATELYLARGLTFHKPHTENTEEIRPIKMRLSEALRKVMAGELTHSETCVLILKASLLK